MVKKRTAPPLNYIKICTRVYNEQPNANISLEEYLSFVKSHLFSLTLNHIQAGGTTIIDFYTLVDKNVALAMFRVAESSFSLKVLMNKKIQKVLESDQNAV